MIDVSHVPATDPLRVLIGAGEQRWPGWIATQGDELDLLRRDDWAASFSARPPDRLVCEHVFEHLTLDEARAAARIVFEFLAPDGTLRVAVPDANFRDDAYQRLVAVGQLGHQMLYDHRLLSSVFTDAGFDVDLLEYCDDAGRFHFNQWDAADGPIYRSLRTDRRNRDGRLGFVSIILDARKPIDA